MSTIAAFLIVREAYAYAMLAIVLIRHLESRDMFRVATDYR
jgi:hypothetical protein